MSFKNKAYSNTKKSSGTSKAKDFEAFYYHSNQTKAQDRLVKAWLKKTGNKL